MKWLFPSIFLVLVGCQVKVDQPVTQAPEKATESTPAPSAPTTAAKSSLATSTPDEQKQGFNKNRVHQLYDLRTTTLTINGQKLTTYVMDNDALREEGFMFVKDEEVKPDQAMIFVFPDAKEQSFWMHNTIMPLDIAYIAPDKTVVSATTMKPMDDSSVPSHGKAMYALEMKKGTIERLGIHKGTKVEIPPEIKTDQ